MNRILLGYSPDLDLFDDTPGAAPGHADRDALAADAQNVEQATELLGVADLRGLTEWLARVVRRSALASGRALDDSVATELSALLQSAARTALPATKMAGAGSARASRFFGIELEGLSPEDQEFEAARSFVQLTTEAARRAALAPARWPPAAAARLAARQAARRYAPGWLGAAAPAVLTASNH